VKNNTVRIFDIETGPRARQIVESFAGNFKAFTPPGDFDPSTVALGNVKDVAKQAEKIEAARLKHEASKLTARDDYEAERKAFYDAAYERAALSAITGRVLTIGVKEVGKPSEILCADDNDDSERELLTKWWELVSEAQISSFSRLVGHNIKKFDLPFLIQRSYYLGVEVPHGVIENDRYFSRIFIDTMERFTCGAHGVMVSLDTLARFFGCPGKDTVDCTGARFAAMYLGSEEDRNTAITYLGHDLIMTESVATFMGITTPMFDASEL
jgi:hypothetical protein